MLRCGSRPGYVEAYDIYYSAYMTKNKPTGSSSANVQAPASTSETSTTIPVGNPTVPQAAANVNAEGVETRLSQTVETVRDAAVTPDAVKQSINENIENGGYRYIPESNADAVASARWHQPDGGICAHHLRRTAGGKNLPPARWKRCISENYKYFPLTGKNNVEQPEQTSGLLHCILL